MKNNKKSVKKNYIYNLLYQIFTMIIPLVTTPYISEVLKPDGVGQYSYTYSLVSYFVLVSQLGFGYYAQREIAKYEEDKKKQSLVFYEVLIAKFLSVSVSILIYVICCLGGAFGSYTTLMWWWILLIITQFFDISFLFQGNEEFGKIVVRNMIIKILGILIIFLTIKNTNDVWLYILSVSLSNLLGAISMWFYLPKYLVKVNRKDINPRRHLLPSLRLFIPSMAAIIYSYVDKSLIGTLVKGNTMDSMNVEHSIANIENGLYEQSEKIIKIGALVLTALGSVMLPRNAKVFTDGNKKELAENIKKSLSFTLFLGSPIMFGLLAISNNLIPWFLGNEFEKSIIYLKLFSPLIILFGIDNVFGIQYLLAIGKDKKYTIAVVSGTLINIVLNIILIPKFWGTGAIASSIVSEIIIVGIMYKEVRNSITCKSILKDIIKYLIFGSIMAIIVFIISTKLTPAPIHTCVLIAIGTIIYLALLFISKDNILFSVIKAMKRKLFKETKK